MIRNYLKIYNNQKIKNGFIRDYIPNIGKVVLEKDKIVCYVSERKLNHESRSKTHYNLQCTGIITKNHSPKLMEELNLTKPVYYVFDGITFDRPIRLMGTQCSIIFKNCTFMNEIHISKADSITLENNHYIDASLTHTNSFINGKVTKLEMINESFLNEYENHTSTDKFGMDINANIFIMQGSTIVADKPRGNVIFKINKFTMENSLIVAPEIFIEANNFNMSNNSSLVADKNIFIESLSIQNSYNCLSPLIIYNGIEFVSNKQTPKIIVNKEKLELQDKRKELINILLNLKDKCINERKTEISEVVRKR